LSNKNPLISQSEAKPLPKRSFAQHSEIAPPSAYSALSGRSHNDPEQAVTNQVVDIGLLTETAEPARKILDVETIDVVADRGYFKAEDIEACEKAGCIPHVPKPQRGSSVREGFFRKDEFQRRRSGRTTPFDRSAHAVVRHGSTSSTAAVGIPTTSPLSDQRRFVRVA